MPIMLKKYGTPRYALLPTVRKEVHEMRWRRSDHMPPLIAVAWLFVVQSRNTTFGSWMDCMMDILQATNAEFRQFWETRRLRADAIFTWWRRSTIDRTMKACDTATEMLRMSSWHQPQPRSRHTRQKLGYVAVFTWEVAFRWIGCQVYLESVNNSIYRAYSLYSLQVENKDLLQANWTGVALE